MLAVVVAVLEKFKVQEEMADLAAEETDQQ